jgi:hypothetical protein
VTRICTAKFSVRTGGANEPLSITLVALWQPGNKHVLWLQCYVELWTRLERFTREPRNLSRIIDSLISILTSPREMPVSCDSMYLRIVPWTDRGALKLSETAARWVLRIGGRVRHVRIFGIMVQLRSCGLPQIFTHAIAPYSQTSQTKQSAISDIH